MAKSKASSKTNEASSESTVKPVEETSKKVSIWTETMLGQIVSSLYLVGSIHLLYKALSEAYNIRLHAINEYGRVIHEFDPYFNYRAAEYLWQHGTSKFFKWFDYMSWYPLGRPVGTTIFPGMQFTSMWIKMFILPEWSINDICCFVPVWFGVIATFTTALLCYVCVQSIATADPQRRSLLQDIPILSFLTNKVLLPILKFGTDSLKQMTGSNFGLAAFQKNPPALESAVFTACFMSIVPAHLTRSVGGGYDNESVATTAMQLTFWMWTTTQWVPEGRATYISAALSGLAYFYMVAAWGGYIFVINLVGLHAAFLVFTQKTSWNKIYSSYTIFYAIGTFLAMQLPVVNWQPVKSLEQLGPFFVFAGMQVLQLMFYLEKRRPAPKSWADKWNFRMSVLAGCAVACAPVLFMLWKSGFFGPLSSRVRGLFVKHTKTGNPLVDSVAEHQAASPEAYYQYLNVVKHIAPFGFGIIALVGCTPSSSFLLLYGTTSYFFSHKMVRLVLLTAPIASVCAGIACGYAWAWGMSAIFGVNDRPSMQALFTEIDDDEEEFQAAIEEAKRQSLKAEEKKQSSGRKKKGSKKDASNEAAPPSEEEEKTEEEKKAGDADASSKKTIEWGDPIWTRLLRLVLAAYLLREAKPHFEAFYERCHSMAVGLSHPTIIVKGRNQRTGKDVVVDDYREAYWWLRDNTPEDARIMAWWDYGYQITGIANRTTIADGNTWNHEHIALLGRALTSSEKEGHRIARHMADYVLVWAGGGGDDLAKSPHLRRIANSVYHGLCREPTCRGFGFIARGEPSIPLKQSLLYTLHSHGNQGVSADRNRFREVYKSKYGKVRIFQILSVSEESKQWVLDNRKCDGDGSWYCPGQYPPALRKILDQKRDFAQLEDFNRNSGGDSEYQRQYFENLNNPKGAAASNQDMNQKTADSIVQQALQDGGSMPNKLSDDTIASINKQWENTEMTGLMYRLVAEAQIDQFQSIMLQYPEYAHVRSEDGRGPMWWAHEFGRPVMIRFLKAAGVSEHLKDKDGITPLDLSNSKS